MPKTRGQQATSAIAFREEVGDTIANAVDAQGLYMIRVRVHVWFPGWAEFPANTEPWDVRSEVVCVRTHRSSVEYSTVRHQLMDYIYQCWPKLSSGCDEVEISLHSRDEQMIGTVNFLSNANPGLLELF